MSECHQDEWNALCADTAIARWMTVSGRPLSAADAFDARQRNIQHWEKYGFGLWMFFDDQRTQFVGRAGLRKSVVFERDVIELAYCVRPHLWSQGYATEMGSVCLQTGFATLGLEEIWCYTLNTNRASQRVIEKLGFDYVGQGEHAGLPHVFNRLTRNQWRQQNTCSSG